MNSRPGFQIPRTATLEENKEMIKDRKNYMLLRLTCHQKGYKKQWHRSFASEKSGKIKE